MAMKQDASTGEMHDDGQAAADKPKNVSSTGKPMIQVKVHSPFKVYYDELAFSISAVNDTGPFDILPHHHNFMTLLNPCEVSIVNEKGTVHIRIARGVMHVRSDAITVFLDV